MYQKTTLIKVILINILINLTLFPLAFFLNHWYQDIKAAVNKIGYENYYKADYGLTDLSLPADLFNASLMLIASISVIIAFFIPTAAYKTKGVKPLKISLLLLSGLTLTIGIVALFKPGITGPDETWIFWSITSLLSIVLMLKTILLIKKEQPSVSTTSPLVQSKHKNISPVIGLSDYVQSLFCLKDFSSNEVLRMVVMFMYAASPIGAYLFVANEISFSSGYLTMTGSAPYFVLMFIPSLYFILWLWIRLELPNNLQDSLKNTVLLPLIAALYTLITDHELLFFFFLTFTGLNFALAISFVKTQWSENQQNRALRLSVATLPILTI